MLANVMQNWKDTGEKDNFSRFLIYVSFKLQL